MKKYNEEIENLAIDYEYELNEQLSNLIAGLKIKGRYKEWSLQDCYDMQKFYDLLQDANYKAAYNKLPYLWKEAGLVPGDLAKLIFDMYYKNE